MINIFKFILLTLITLSLIGCGVAGHPLRNQITRSNAFEADYLQGSIYLLQQKHQNGSVEYTNYAKYVEEHLIKQGFAITKDKMEARYAMILNYGIGGGRELLSASTTYNDENATSKTTVHSTVVYGKYFKLKIVDLKKSNADNLHGVYEGLAQTSSKDGTFLSVSRCLIDAIFAEFLQTGSDNRDFGYWKTVKGRFFGGDTSCKQ